MRESAIFLILAGILRFSAPIFAVTAAEICLSWLMVDVPDIDRCSLVEPSLRIVLFLLPVPAGKQPVEIFRVPEVLAQDHGRVGVVDDVVAELLVVLENVTNQGAKEENVAAGTQRHPNIGHRRGAGEARVDMDNFCPLLTRFDHPLKTYGMVLGHRRPHDENNVGITKILLCGSRGAATKGSAQTGHAGAMSYTSLVGDTHYTQACGEQFFDEIILFVIEGRSPEMSNGSRLHDNVAVFAFLERALAAVPQSVGTMSMAISRSISSKLREYGRRYFTFFS